MTIGEARIQSVFQKLEQQIEIIPNSQTKANLETIRNYAIEAQAKLETKLNYAIEAQKFVVQSREAVEVVSRPTIHQT